MTFTTIIVNNLEHLKMSHIEIKTKPKDANSSCKCGKILMNDEPVGVLRKRDSLGRSIAICTDCRNKTIGE